MLDNSSSDEFFPGTYLKANDYEPFGNPRNIMSWGTQNGASVGTYGK